jgi:hypothetical protein
LEKPPHQLSIARPDVRRSACCPLEHEPGSRQIQPAINLTCRCCFERRVRLSIALSGLFQRQSEDQSEPGCEVG